METGETERDPKCVEKKHKNCTINIFCNDLKHGHLAGGKWDGIKCSDGCVINIFCNDAKNGLKWDGGMCDGDKHGCDCVINIFCCDGAHDGKCDDKKCV